MRSVLKQYRNLTYDGLAFHLEDSGSFRAVRIIPPGLRKGIPSHLALAIATATHLRVVKKRHLAVVNAKKGRWPACVIADYFYRACIVTAKHSPSCRPLPISLN